MREAGETYFDADEADLYCDFFPDILRLATGANWAGQPFHLQDWQRDWWRKIIGTKKADGTRLYEETFLLIGKGNGKTQLAAGAALALLILDAEPSAEIYIIATTVEQAAQLFRDCANMVQMSPELTRLIPSSAIKQQSKEIHYTRTNSKIKVLANEPRALHGKRPSVVICDEIAQWDSRDSYDALKQSLNKGRKQTLIISISHAGLVGTFGHEHYLYAKQVEQGSIQNPKFLPVLYEASKDDDPFVEATWRKANPSWGVTINPTKFAETAQAAKDQPSALNHFLTWNLNIFTQQVDRWIPMHLWDMGAVPTFSRESLRGRTCYIGIDIAGTYDTTAVVAVFPPTANDPNYYVLPYIFLPRDSALERDRQDNIGYQQWARDGHMTLTDGGYIDYKILLRTVQELAKEYNVQTVTLDKNFNGGAVYTDLCNEGFRAEAFTQNTRSYNEACKRLEGLVKTGQIKHNGHPVLKWQASNVSLYRDSFDQVRPFKPEGRNKIDAICALLMGLSAAMVGAATPEKKSVYESRGLLVL